MPYNNIYEAEQGLRYDTNQNQLNVAPIDYTPTPTLAQAKKLKLDERAASKYEKMPPQDRSKEFAVRNEGIINNLKSAANYLIPQAYELEKYHYNPETQTTALLNEDTNQELVNGYFDKSGYFNSVSPADIDSPFKDTRVANIDALETHMSTDPRSKYQKIKREGGYSDVQMLEFMGNDPKAQDAFQALHPGYEFTNTGTKDYSGNRDIIQGKEYSDYMLSNGQVVPGRDASEADRLLNANAKAQGLGNYTTEAGTKLMDSTSIYNQFDSDKRNHNNSILGRTANVAKAFGNAVAGQVVDLADFGVEAMGGDLGTDEEKTAYIKKFIGYDSHYDERAQAIAGQAIDRMHKFGVSTDSVGDILGLAISNPEMIGTSLGYVIPMLISTPVSATARAAQAVNMSAKALKASKLTGSAKAALEMEHAALVANAEKVIASTGAKFTPGATVAEQAANIEKQFTTMGKATTYLADNAGIFAFSAGKANDDINARIVNNDGIDDLGMLTKAGIYFSAVIYNKVDTWADMGILKSPEVLNGVKLMAKAMSAGELKNTAIGLTKTVTYATANFTKEGGTEGLQEVMDTIVQQYKTKSNSDDLDELLSKNMKNIETSVAMGVAGAGQFTAASMIKTGSAKGLGTIVDKVKPKPDGDYVTSAAAADSLKTIHTAAAKEGFKDIASGKTPATPEQHVFIDGHIKTLEDEVNSMPDSVTGNTRDDLVDGLATALSMKAAMNRGKGTVLNSRPMDDIDNDITTETAKDAPDEKVLHRLSVEKEIAGLNTQSTGTEQVNVAKASGMLASDSHALKFYGGTVDNQRRTGLLEYIDALDSTPEDSKIHQQLKERLRHFIATQNVKLDEMKKAKKEYDVKFDAWKQNGEQGMPPRIQLSDNKFYDGSTEKGMLEPQQQEFDIMSKVGDRYLSTSNYSEPDTTTTEAPQTETGTPVTPEAASQSTDYEQAANGEPASAHSNKQSTTGSTSESPINNETVRAVKELEAEITRLDKEAIDNPSMVDANNAKATAIRSRISELEGTSVSEDAKQVPTSKVEAVQPVVTTETAPAVETKLGEQDGKQTGDNTTTPGAETSQGREQASNNEAKSSTENSRQDKAATKVGEVPEVESDTVTKMRAELAAIKADTNKKMELLRELSIPYNKDGIAKGAQLEAAKLQGKYANEIDTLRKNLSRIPAILDKQLADIKRRNMPQRLEQEEEVAKQARLATKSTTNKLREATSVQGLAKRRDNLRSVNNMAEFATELDDNIRKNKERMSVYKVAIAAQKQEDAYNASIGGQLIDDIDASRLKSKDDVVRKYNATNPIKVAKVPMKAKTVSENQGLGTHFTFNGKGVDTSIINELVDGADVFTSKDTLPLRGTLETVGKIVEAMGTLERSDKIATMTEDYHIAYDPMGPTRYGKGFTNVSRLLMSVVTKVVPNGNTVFSHFELNGDVKNAMALGFVDWLGAMAAPMRAEVRSEADTNRLIGLDSKAKSTAKERARVANIDGTIPNAANTLGAAIWDYLGLKAKRSTETVNRDLMQANMKTELGLLAMMAAEEAGLVEITKGVLQTDLFGYTAPEGATIATYKVTSNVQDGKLKDEKPNIVTGNGVINSNIVEGSKDIAENILDTNIRLSTSIYWNTEETKVDRDSIVNEGLAGELGATTSEMQKDAIEKQNADGRVFNNRFTDGLKVLGTEYFEKIMGYTHDVDTTVHKEDRAATHGKNLGIRDQLKYYQEALLESEKRSNAPMFAKWYIMSNNRFGIKSNTFNWQDKKLHRHSVEKRKVEIAKDSAEEQVFLLAIAQSMDIGIDKIPFEKSMEKLQKVTDALDKVLDGSPNKVKTGFEYMVSKGMTGEPELALLGLVEYIAYKEARAAGTKFSSGMTIETDAVTSGYILKILQMPIFTDAGNLDMGKVYRELARGGVLKESEKQAYGEWRSTEGNKDSYEVPAELLTTKLKATMSNPGNTNKVNIVMSLLGENLTKGISRAFMKNPFMTLNYGSAIRTIIENKARIAEANIYKLLTEAHTSTDARQELVSIMEVAGVPAGVITKLKQAHKDRTMLEFDIGTKNIQLIKDAVTEVLKDPLTETFNEQYGDFIKATATINSSFQMMFRAAEPMIKARMDAKLEELGAYINGKPRSLTNSEIKEIMTDLVKVLPVFKMAFADNNSNIGLISKRGKGQYEVDTDTNDQAQGNIFGVGNGSTLTASTTLYKMVESYTGGAPITVHFMDAMIQAAVLSKIESIGVHDANILDVLNAIPGTKAYNEAVAILAEEYSLTTEILSSMNDTMNAIGIDGLKALDKRYKAEAVESDLNRALSSKYVNRQDVAAIRNNMKAIVESLISDNRERQITQLEALEVVNGLKGFVEGFDENELATATEIYSNMHALQKLSEEGRYELLNNKSLYIEHSALALEGAGIVTEAKPHTKQVPSTKLDPVFNIAEPVEPAKAKTKEDIISDIEAIHAEFKATKEADKISGLLNILNKILKGC